VLVPTKEFVAKLQAARLAADVCDVPTVLIARTDALGAYLLTSDIDEYDAPFLTGGSAVLRVLVCGARLLRLGHGLAGDRAASRAAVSHQVCALLTSGARSTPPLATIAAPSPPAGERTSEGFYCIRGGIDAAIARGLAYAPHADMLWFETSDPSMEEATVLAGLTGV
jgi:isocitrate lyase